MKRFFLTLCALCATTALWAATETVNGIEWTYRISDGKASIGNGLFAKRAIPSSTSGSITIPSSLGGYPVTSIGSQAFGGCKSLTSVTIPSSVTSIGQGAFGGCPGLKKVHISDLAAWCAIDFNDSSSNPLYYAKQLYLNGRLVTNPEIPSGVVLIRKYAFYNCAGLTSIKIPASVAFIGDEAFSGCPKLKVIVDSANQHYMTPRNGALLTKDMTKILHGPASATSCTIPKGVTSIGAGAFSGYTDLTSVTIPPSVNEIGDYAFDGCESLTSVKIPPTVTSIGAGAFCDCSGLTSITIPSSVTSIGMEAFACCISLTSVTIPPRVTEIAAGTFIACKGLTSVAIPEGVTAIGYNAFSNCTSLRSVTIPSSVTRLEEGVFSYCEDLTLIEFLGTPPKAGEGESASILATFDRSDFKVSGTYLPKYASQWEAVIKNGKWNDLKMKKGRGLGQTFSSWGRKPASRTRR